MTQPTRDRVDRWLDEAGTAMAGAPDRRTDVLLELETTIYERIDELLEAGEQEADAVSSVLDALGDPTQVGSGFLPDRPLLAVHQTRSYLINTMVVFAAHFLCVVGATVAGADVGISRLRIDPIADPANVIGIFFRALEVLFFDAGLVLFVFAFFPRVGRLIRLPRASLAVRPDARRCTEGALFLVLVLVVVNFLRDNLLALYVPIADGTVRVPMVGPGFLQNLVWLNVWLGLAVFRDLLYARFGERRATLGLDLAATAAGLFCLLRLVAAKHLIDLTRAGSALGNGADGMAALLNTTFTLLALVAAALLAGRLTRRVVRFFLAPTRGRTATKIQASGHR